VIGLIAEAEILDLLDLQRGGIVRNMQKLPFSFFPFFFIFSAYKSFFPELNEPACPAAALPVSHDAGGRAAGESAVCTERQGQDRRKPTKWRP
jgi:hypothetical protein